MIRVLIADDHKLMRAGLKALLVRAGDIEIVGEAKDGLEAVDLALSKEPDVVLMDVAMPDVDGIQAAQQLVELAKSVKILMMSGYSDDVLLHQAMQVGVHGYVIKDSNPQELATAIRAVHKGEKYFSPEVFSICSEEIVKR